MKFYLGTHEVSWLARVTDIPLFISHRRLARQKTHPRATTSWALDSGGFTEISTYGKWTIGQSEYVDAVGQYHDTIGRLEWASPQDWMCEAWILEKTGLSVRDHQDKTVSSVLSLRHEAPSLGFIPVLQGQMISDYQTCVDLYKQAGIDLWAEPVVGVGSVCRRQSTKEVHEIMTYLSGLGLRLHGFGVKAQGLRQYGPMLTSADSMAWSFRARQRYLHEDWRMDGCTHKTCANCMRYALSWRTGVLDDFRNGKRVTKGGSVNV